MITPGSSLGIRIPPRDAVNILAESDTLAANLIDAFIVDTTSGPDLDAASVRKWMERVIDRSTAFARRVYRRPLDLGDPFWVAATPDLATQVTVVEAAAPGWAPVEAVVAEMLDTRTDPTDHSWECRVVSGVRDLPGLPASVCVFVLKMHHSAMDGLGIAALMHALFSDELEDIDRVGNATVEPIPRLGSELRALPRQLGRLVRAQWAQRKAPLLSSLKPPKVGPTAPAADGGSIVRVLWFELARIRAAVGSAPGHATVNDFMLTAVSIALDELLTTTGRAATTLTAIMPIDIGAYRDTGTANKTTFTQVDLRPDLADPAERLQAIHEHTVALKTETARRESADALTNPLEILPAPVGRAAAAVTRRLTPHANRLDVTIVSNIPHSRSPVFFDGAPVVAAFHPLQTGGGIGLAHNLTSLGNRLGVTITAGSAAVPDPDAYAEIFRRALTTLESALHGRSDSTNGHTTPDNAR